MTEYEHEEDPERLPPSRDRVLRRAWVTASVACRGFLETFDDPLEAATLLSRLLTWIDTVNLRSEFEPWELFMVEEDIGSLDQQTIVNGTWRTEGLVVLAWALGATRIPPYDQMADPGGVSNLIHFLKEDALEKSQGLRLLSGAELDGFAGIQLALHWRLRDFSLRLHPMDFRKFNEKPWYGAPVSLEGVPLAEDDLAIDGVPIARAPTSRFRQCQSIAMERHKAINWLLGLDETYSEVDTST